MYSGNVEQLKLQQGFTLIELMVALAIGLFLIAGVFTVFVNGNQSKRVVDDQVVMIDNARFALETMSADLRQAGVFGRVKPKISQGQLINITRTGAVFAGDCVPGWVEDAFFPVRGFNGPTVSLYPGCITNYFQGDVLEMRGSLLAPVVAPVANRMYINSDVNNAQIFRGAVSPNISAAAKNYQYYVNLYYVAANSDNTADGIPSLHRVSLQPDGTVVDQMLLSGVENMQVQFGLDTSGNDGVVDSYVPPQNVADWTAVKTVKIWLVVRALAASPGLDTTITANIEGNFITLTDPVSVDAPGGANDNIRRSVISTIATLRQF